MKPPARCTVPRSPSTRRGWLEALRRVAVSVAVLVAIGCGGNRRDPVLRAVRPADQAWRKRADPGGLDTALQAYLNVDQAYPEDSRVLWRLSRMYTMLGDESPADAVRHYATAREFGLRCLMLEPSFAGLVISRGGRVVPAAAAELTEESKECLVWTTIAWTRWVRARGTAGVGLDHAVLSAMGARAAELAGDWGSGRGHYAHGLALALPPPALSPDLKGAKAAFERAIDAAPERYTPKVDLALYVLQPMGKTDKASAMLREVAEATIPADDPEKLEDRHAINRARAALGMEPLPPEAPPEPEVPAEEG